MKKTVHMKLILGYTQYNKYYKITNVTTLDKFRENKIHNSMV